MATSVPFPAMSSLVRENSEIMRLIISFRLTYIIFLRVHHVKECAYEIPRDNFEVEEQLDKVASPEHRCNSEPFGL